jgi:uncharacterized membrane protein YfhO
MNTKSNKKIVNIFYGLGAFILTGIFFLLALKISHIYPFGDNTIIYHDMQYQYLDYLTYFRNLLHGSGNIAYSFSIGMGEGTAAFFAYYLASPFNIILAFFSEDKIVLGITFLIMLKLASSAVTMFIYLSKRFSLSNLSALLLALSYSMMGYNVLNCSNIMWLDGIIILPLIALGIHNLVYQNKKIMYFFALWYGIITNWYIGYMLCIFAVVYFIVENVLYYMKNKQNKKGLFKSCTNFVFVSILSGMATMVLILPQTLQMLSQGESDFLKGIRANFNCSFLEGFKDLFLNGEKLTKQQTNPPIYVGSFPIICIASLFVNKKERISKKYFALILICIGMAAYIFNPLNYLFSVMKIPSNHYYRHAFLFSFLLIMLAGMALQAGIKAHGVLAAFIIGLLYDFVLNYEDKTSFYFGLTCMILIGIFMLCYKLLLDKQKNKLCTALLATLLILFVGFEHVKDWNLELTDHTYTNSRITNYNQEISSIMNDIKREDSSIYRIDKTSARFSNYNCSVSQSESMSFDYHYSSTRNVALSEFLMNNGYASVTKLTPYHPIPVMDALLGVKYVIGQELPSDYHQLTNIGSENAHVYQNPYYSGMAYIVQNNLKGSTSLLPYSENPFESQSAFISAISGLQDNYYFYNATTQIDTDHSCYCVWEIHVTHNGPLYAYIKNGSKNLNISVNDDLHFENYWFNNSIRYIGEFKQGDIVRIKASNGTNADQFELYATTLNYNSVTKALDVIRANNISITDWKDGEVKAHITANQNSQIMFTIPYEKGWIVKVNGSRVNYSDYAGAFITFNVPAGENDITMYFRTPGLTTGFIISILSILIFCIWIFFDHKHKTCKPLQ